MTERNGAFTFVDGKGGTELNSRDNLMIKLRFSERFDKLVDSLCLTDRQKQIARLKYLRGWANEDVAAHVGVCRKTVTEEMKVISEIIGSVDVDKFIEDCIKKDSE